MRGCKNQSLEPSPESRRAKKRRVFGIPKRRTTEIYVHTDGREVLSGRAKYARWQEVYQLDGGRCVKCHERVEPPYTDSMRAAEIHHVNRRGMNGSKRDDRIEVAGKRNLETLCKPCHREEGPQIQFGATQEVGA